jgi:hypothetical protein
LTPKESTVFLPSVQQPISKDKNVMARARKYYLKNKTTEWNGLIEIDN